MTRIDKYNISEELGSSKLLKTYIVTVDGKPDKKVILKVLNKEFKSKEEIFQRAYKINTKVTSKTNLAEITSLAGSKDNTILERVYVEGKNLKLFLDGRPLDKDKIKIISPGLFEGLRHLHIRGEFHGGLDPYNIILTPEEKVKITDFYMSISSILACDSEDSEKIAYLSPEHIKEPEKVSFKSDIYSLGVVFLEMLTGTNPFKDKNIEEVKKKINKGYKSGYDVIDKAIDINPENRYKTVREFGEAFIKFLSEVKESPGIETKEETSGGLIPKGKLEEDTKGGLIPKGLPPPELWLEKNEIKIEKLDPGETTEVKFRIKNKGGETLEGNLEVSDSVFLTCLPDKFSLDHDREITISVTIAGLKGKGKGKIILNTNDPSRKKKEIEVIVKSYFLPESGIPPGPPKSKSSLPTWAIPVIVTGFILIFGCILLSGLGLMPLLGMRNISPQPTSMPADKPTPEEVSFIPTDPPDNSSMINEKLNLARSYYESGNYKDAISCSKGVLNIDSKNVEAFVMIGDSYRKLKNPDKAAENYKKVLQIEPDSEMAHVGMGNIYRQNGDMENAIAHYKKAPSLAWAHNNLGAIYLLQNNFNGAIKEFEQAKDIDPDDYNTYVNLGSAYYNKENWDRSIDYYNKAIEINSNKADAYYGIGLSYGKKDNKSEAIKNFKKFIELAPGDSRVTTAKDNINALGGQ